MSERMIEECAKALCEDAGWKWGEQSLLRDRYRRRARVVFSHLDALGYAVVPKEPTPGMVNSGAIAALETREAQRTASFHSGAGDEVRASFRAMIDAALEGK